MADGRGDEKIYAHIDYEDPYVQPLLIAALTTRIPSELLVFINDISELPSPTSKFLQWRQYESVDFDLLLQHPTSSLANTFVIRKALIRKHFLSATVSHWLKKHPDSVIGKHVKSGVEFEVDYAEFLDDALVEAYELRESWARNESKSSDEKEWWILKPGMSDRGQGIRLFSSAEDLTSIFEQWDPDSDEDDQLSIDGDKRNDNPTQDTNRLANGVITCQLRHFVAQPYIHPPLLLPEPHESAGRKFHIRAYVLAVGALKVYVFEPMLALFAGEAYVPPSVKGSPNNNLASHLTNTCLQNGDREGTVHRLQDLPPALPHLSKHPDWRDDVVDQICKVVGEVFEAGARSTSVHFQPLPNAFEIYGVDFLVDNDGTTWLLEINAFPDFAQTGVGFQSLVRDLFVDVVNVAVKPFFEVAEPNVKTIGLVQVLDLDLGRRHA